MKAAELVVACFTAAAKHADMDPKNFSEKMARYRLRRVAANDPGEGGPRPA